MKLSRICVPIVAMWLCNFELTAQGQSVRSGSTVIEVSLTQYVVSQQVHRNNPPFQWRNVDYMVLYDIDGIVRAYAFIFSKTGAPFQSPVELRRHILEKSAQLGEARKQHRFSHPGGTANRQM